MRFLGIAALVAAVLSACSRTGDSESVETSIAGGDSGGVAGATDASTSTSTGASGVGDGGAPACMPADVFVGWDGCYRPDPLCCSDLYCINVAARCEVETSGLTEPYLCATAPPVTDGGLTDFRSCLQLPGDVDIDCVWGPSAILCCEPQ